MQLSAHRLFEGVGEGETPTLAFGKRRQCPKMSLCQELQRQENEAPGTRSVGVLELQVWQDSLQHYL
jgi:hypothetical protein